jgi:hypothetical protein
VAGGGKCEQGAASAAFGKYATNNIDIYVKGEALKFAATVTAGGVGSMLAGGKFENGATTATYGYLFNYCTTQANCWQEAAEGFTKAVTYVGEKWFRASATVFGALGFVPAAPELVGAGLAARSVPALRQAYVAEVAELRAAGESLKAAGADAQQLARVLHAERRAIGEEYKALTPVDKLTEIYQRNITTYGDKLGPTIDWLRNQGKSWEQITESAGRTGGKDLGF